MLSAELLRNDCLDNGADLLLGSFERSEFEFYPISPEFCPEFTLPLGFRNDGCSDYLSWSIVILLNGEASLYFF
jgi:hypothetical protein